VTTVGQSFTFTIVFSVYSLFVYSKEGRGYRESSTNTNYYAILTEYKLREEALFSSWRIFSPSQRVKMLIHIIWILCKFQTV